MDWNAAQSRLQGTSERVPAANLKALADLAEKVALSTGASRRLARAADSKAGTGHWLIVGLATIKVALGLAGFLVVEINRPPGAVPAELLALVSTVFAIAAAALVSGGRADRRAQHLAGLFVLVAAACSRPLANAFLASWPVQEVGAVLAALLPESFLALMLWRFVRDFPRLVRLGADEGVLQLGVRLSALVGTVLFAVNLLIGVVPIPGSIAPILGSLALDHESGRYWSLLFLLALGALVLARRRNRDAEPEERRRVHLFMTGIVVGSVPILATVLVAGLVPAVHRLLDDPRFLRPVAFVDYFFVLTIPLTTAIAVRMPGLLNVQWILRRTTQYLLARTSLLALLALPGLLLVGHLYRNREQSLASLLTGPQAGTLLGLVALGAVLLLMRRPLLRALDRVFFRTEANLQSILATAHQHLRQAQSPEEAASALARHAAEALRSESGFVWFRASDTPDFVPLTGGIRPLPAGSALASLVSDAQESEPFVVAPDAPSSLYRWFPEADRQWIVDMGLAVMAPLPQLNGGPSAVLGVGPKGNGLPYSREDFLFLTALGAAAAPALERVQGIRSTTVDGHVQPNVDEPAGECPTCGTVWPRAGEVCKCGAATQPGAIPAVLNGKFRLEKLLGRGGMGVVYRAEDLALGRRVGLKTLPRVSPEAVVRLRLEARSTAAVTHPHLALIYGAESWRGVPVLVMEYLAGGTLADRIKKGPLPVHEVLALGATLAGALEALHAHGILHRDIKPTNIGFAQDGQPKLLDFGVAQMLDDVEHGSPVDSQFARPDLTDTGTLLGTPLYLPPEAMEGAAPDRERDVWALGVAIYEAIAGRHPLRETRELSRALRNGFQDVRDLRPDCPADVASLLGQVLAPARQKRLAEASRFREAMAALSLTIG